MMAVKQGDGSVMIWCCFAASGPGHFAVVDKTTVSVIQMVQ